MSLVSDLLFPLKRRIGPPFGFALIRGLSRTLDVEVIGEDHLDTLLARDERIIYAFWHGNQFYPIFHFRNRRITILSSLSRDGEIQTDILTRFGYEVVRGSSSRGGVQGLLALARTLEAGRSIALAVDGPRGPAHEAKAGISLLSERSGAVIVPISIAFEREKRLSAWDAYRIPKPYTRGVMIVGPGFRARDLHHPAEAHTHLTVMLETLEERATERLSRRTLA